MALIPWKAREEWLDPFRDLQLIQKEMNRLFDFSLARDVSRGDISLLESGWTPAIDLYDSKDNFMVKADLPGLRKEDIEVTVRGATLMIRGEKKTDTEVNDKEYVRNERTYGSFCRTLSLPTEVDSTKVTASYSNGVLELVLPKKEENKPRQVSIDVK